MRLIGLVRVAALAFLVPAAGCGTFVTATPLNPAPFRLMSRPASKVEIYSSSPPSRAHIDVALLEVEQTDSLNEQGTSLMIERLRQHAGEMGCHAVVVGGMTARDGAPPGSGFDVLDPGSRTIHATCLVYTDQRPAEPPPNPLRTPRTWAETAGVQAGPAKPVPQQVDRENP